MSTAMERPLRADAARNRQLIIDAARELFAEEGIDVTLDDVARRAGVASERSIGGSPARKN